MAIISIIIVINVYNIFYWPMRLEHSEVRFDQLHHPMQSTQHDAGMSIVKSAEASNLVVRLVNHGSEQLEHVNWK